MVKLFPNREVFHVSEIVSYYYSVAWYFIQKEDFQKAETIKEIIKDLDDQGDKYEAIESTLIQAKFQKKLAVMIAAKENLIHSENLPLPKTTKTKRPSLHHPELNELYDFEIENLSLERMNEFCLFNRKTLIQDLNTILKDTIERYSFLLEDNDYDSPININIENRVTQVIFIIIKIDAQECIPNLFEFFSQNDELITCYLGSDYHDFLLDPMAFLFRERWAEISKITRKSRVPKYSKSFFYSCVISNFSKQNQDLIRNWFIEEIDFILDAKIEDNIVDSTTNGLLIGDLEDITNDDVNKKNHQLFDREGYVDTRVCGDRAYFFDNLKKNVIVNITEKGFDLDQWYKDFCGLYSSDMNELDDFQKNDLRSLWNRDQNNSKENILYPDEPILSDKVGRNDPCPCGSGKKYKKCCLD